MNIKIITMEFCMKFNLSKKDKLNIITEIKCNYTEDDCLNFLVEFYLNEKKDKSKITKTDVGKTVAGSVIAKKSLDHGLHRVAGLRGETHSTSDGRGIKKSENWLDPKKGGTGASRITPDLTNLSKDHSYITGYNKDTLKKGFTTSHNVTDDIIDTPAKLRNYQAFYKKDQKMGYRFGGTHGLQNKVPFRHSKTFHIMGTEDFYDKNFKPDPDDLALMTKKKLKVSNSKLGATVQGIKRYGLKGLKSAPKGRAAIGVATLAGGGYAASKLIEPLWVKMMKKYHGDNEVAYAKSLIKKGKMKEARKYIAKKFRNRSNK